MTSELSGREMCALLLWLEQHPDAFWTDTLPSPHRLIAARPEPGPEPSGACLLLWAAVHALAVAGLTLGLRRLLRGRA